MFYCFECGQRYEVDADGVSRHLTDDGGIDYDADEDHAAYGDDPVLSESNAEVGIER